jgi:RND family efflux transporter MFP subunit
VYATADDVPVIDEGEPAGIAFLKEQQWKTPGFATAFAVQGTATETFEVAGEIIPAAGRFADVQAPVAGLIDAEGVEAAPVPGGRVSRGQVLAVLTAATSEGGNIHAEARARLREAEDEHARAQRLVQAGAAPRRRLHEAEIQLDAAREAMVGLGTAGEGGRYEIRAPIAGIVLARHAAPGVRVDAGSTLFTIVNPDVVWLQSFVPLPQVALIARADAARFRVEGLDRDFQASRLVSVGASIDPVRRMVPVIHQVGNPGGQLRIGSRARVALSTGVSRAGVLVPSSAVLDDDGRSLIYVQVEGELFEARRVTLGGGTGDRLLVLDGVRAGERIVTGAAFQVRLASLSTAVPTHGHEH